HGTAARGTAVGIVGVTLQHTARLIGDRHDRPQGILMVEDGLPAAASGQDLIDVVAVNERGSSCAAAVLLLDQPPGVIEVTRFSRPGDLHDPAAERVVSIFADHRGVRASSGADQTILFIIVVTESSVLDQVSVSVVTKGGVVD